MNKGKSKKHARKSTLTRDYLIRATYNYLQRFATTEKNLGRVLDRKVRRRLPDTDCDALYDQAKDWIEDIVHKAVQQNLVNDRQFAHARAASLIRSGNSKMKIIQKLQAKGVTPDVIADVMQNLSDQHEDMDFLAAVKYARKRRFGAFSIRHNGKDIVEKERASMCRAGFSYSLAGRVLNMPHDAMEDILYSKD